MTQPSGWYDDPQDPSQLRYWDGVVWSSHVSPKVSPTVEQSHIGMPYGVTPAAARPQSAGSSGAQGAPADSGGFASPQQGQQVPRDLPQAQGQQGQAGDQYSQYGQIPGAPGLAQQGWQSHPATTPDGVPLSGWWLRVAARLLDGMIVSVITLPFTGWFIYQYILGVIRWSEDLAAQSTAGSVPVMPVFPPWDILQYVVYASIVQLLLYGIYEVFFLTRSGATPGKKLVGISVRLRDQAGPPPMKTALGRTACFLAMQLVNAVYLLDVLWPLWDDKKQAIHDKAAHTNVVVGPQPKRDA
jgi:uncharacterized RDD family membrane protein YckC